MKQRRMIDRSCPLGNAMSALGSKWKPILVMVIREKTLRFGQITAQLPVISRKVLTDQLKELEEDGVLTRQEFREIPPRVEYRLTEKGLALLPILHLLEEWEAQYEMKKEEAI